jgi:amidase
MFDQAQERARYLDDLHSQGKSAGPLHGLPVSLKDNFNIKGEESTIGMVSFLDEKASANSPLVDILLDLGAVIYVKTNVPQTMMVCGPDSLLNQVAINIFALVRQPTLIIMSLIEL